ncbi:MAG: DNA-binding protein [Niabella sp.]|nr:DNA-binding protein [Niabella sp.]
MPQKETIRKAQQDKRAGKSPTTQAGEFVHETIKKIRRGVHGARSARQAIAIGLSEARRAGVDLKPPKKGTVSEKTRKSAASAYKKGQAHEPVSPSRSAARKKALKKESTAAASHKALSQQAGTAARKRSAASRSAAAKKAAETKGPEERSRAARKAARTRARHARES